MKRDETAVKVKEYARKKLRRNGRSQMSRTKICIFGLLLVFYLVVTLLLTVISMDAPNESYTHVFSKQFLDHSTQNTPRGFEFNSVHGSSTRLRMAKIQWCIESHYLQPPRNTNALISFPGSGNTWLRYLLEQATGIHTGSIYNDTRLLKNGFLAEGVINGSVLVVKTHEWGPLARKPFAKAILLVRAPGPAIQAEFNRQWGGHLGYAKPKRYNKTEGKYWKQYVEEKLKAWKQINLDWLYNFSGPKHVLFYEQLVGDVKQHIRSILEFLEIPINENLLKCALDRKEGIYRRKRRALNFDPYSSAMKKQFQIKQKEVYAAIYKVALPATKKKRKRLCKYCQYVHRRIKNELARWFSF